jgi:hypothetical protein
MFKRPLVVAAFAENAGGLARVRGERGDDTSSLDPALRAWLPRLRLGAAKAKRMG